MNNSLKRLFMVLVCVVGMCGPMFAQRDSIRFSLLTCQPGMEIYSLFGHTAIRCQNYTKGTDWVFNYGVFSFSTPNFVYRFVKGETDYQLGVIPFKYFEGEYFMRGSSVYGQELNLTQHEKETLLARLIDNYKPAHRTYRYNYFYDNCTTRARDQIEAAISGKVVYEVGMTQKSFRSMIHEYTSASLWSEFGIDFCLGAEADRPIAYREQMFAPFYMKDYASKAFICDVKGEKRPLVLKEEVVVAAHQHESDDIPVSPMMAATLFLIVNVVVAYLRVNKLRIYWGWDVLIYGLQGIAGCVVAFLFFFSIHPTVGSNWLVLLFNPLPLFILPYLIYIGVKKRKTKYYLYKMVYLTLFICAIPFSPQNINITILPLAFGLLVNSASHALVYRKQQ